MTHFLAWSLRPAVLILALSFVGCGSYQPVDPLEDSDDGADPEADLADDDEGGSEWGDEPDCTPASCHERAEEVAGRLENPDPNLTSFVSATCVSIQLFDGKIQGWAATDPATAQGPMACWCAGEPDRDMEYFLHGEPDGPECPVRGRSGACLYDRSDFPGCDAAAESPCGAICDGVQELVRADERHRFQARVRAARCLSEEADCGYIIEAEGSCMVNGWFVQDCATSDDAMFSAYLEEHP